MDKETKEIFERNLDRIKDVANKKDIVSYINYFESELQQAEYEVKKINDFTAPEEIECRKNYVEYCKAMLTELHILKEGLCND